MTTIIMIRLGKVITKLVSPNQAAFITGRSIFNHIELVKRLIDFAEATETNGIILSLDQEKAYDKIRHDYLWDVLRAANLPESLIRTISGLYSGAQSRVIVNGTLSEFFEVIRGTRQGDPLSCILFLLAIEPMSKMIQRAQNLAGFKVKSHDGKMQRLILALFADDSTAFLSENDSLGDLFEILDIWCTAAGAKFNKPKTVAIPIGTEEYREQVITTRRLNENETIGDEIKILPDGESTRILGAHVGNKIPASEGWPQVLDKITQRITKWEKSWPNLEGKRLIIQMILGGMTQFKTKAQGMPKPIERALKTVRKNFFWGNTSIPPVNAQQLELPFARGGWNLLNIEIRNEAIELTRAREMVNFSKSRPIWADLVNETVLARIPSSEPGKSGDASRLDIFRQKLYHRDSYSGSKLPPDIARTLNIARKHNVRIEAEALTLTQRRELPIWMHVGKPPKRRDNNMPKMRCLREIHEVKTTGDMQLQEILYEKEAHDAGNAQCECDSCTYYRDLGCRNPDGCYQAAERSIAEINEKFNPWEPDFPTEPKTTNPQRRERNEQPQSNVSQRGKVSVDTTVYAPRSLWDAFRVFAVGDQTHDTVPDANLSRHIPNEPQHTRNLVTVWTDGSCLHNGDTNARAGYGMWFGQNDPRNEGGRVNTNLPQTNNVGEMLAVLLAMKKINRQTNLLIKTDSDWVIRNLTSTRRKNEDNGYIGVSNGSLIKTTIATARSRTGKTTLEWVKGHADDVGNNEADRLAGEGARKPPNEEPAALRTPRSLNMKGAKLSTATQSLLHKGIKERIDRTIPERGRARDNLDRAREAVWETSHTKPSDDQIWKALRKRRDYPPNMHTFLWKCIQGANKCGPYWSNIPGYEDRGTCTSCDQVESMEHILFQCPENQGEVVWDIAKEICSMKGITWPENFYTGHIYGSNLLVHKNDEGKPRSGAKRLFTIVVTECAFMIWKLRNDRVIEHKDDIEPHHISPQEAKNRTRSALNMRLNVDKLSTNVYKLGKRALPRNVVLNTWTGTLAQEKSLPDDWIGVNGVLVGSLNRRLNGRNR